MIWHRQVATRNFVDPFNGLPSNEITVTCLEIEGWFRCFISILGSKRDSFFGRFFLRIPSSDLTLRQVLPEPRISEPRTSGKYIDDSVRWTDVLVGDFSWYFRQIGLKSMNIWDLVTFDEFLSNWFYTVNLYESISFYHLSTAFPTIWWKCRYTFIVQTNGKYSIYIGTTNQCMGKSNWIPRDTSWCLEESDVKLVVSKIVS